ncbi:HAF repeat-containing protein [Derxia gummosa]|uniref:HAF repeat-containing protein n=1 Tax=Derxia gummosa DSM 723 TaxID=1121388 RepID=A0A8B6X2F2_9BURK|nr:HAF repeat-containing protein [Derxia gummosa]
MDRATPLAALALAAVMATTALAAEPEYDVINLGSFGYGNTPEYPSGRTVPYALNNRRQVTLTSVDYATEGIARDPRPALWSRGTLTQLPYLGSYPLYICCTVPRAINDAGQITGESLVVMYPWEPLRGTHAFVWQDGRMTDLGLLVEGRPPARYTNESQSRGVAISGSGQVVGMSSYYRDGTDLGLRAFSWQGGRMTNLGTLGTDARGYGMSWARALNESGTVVGTAFDYVGGVNRGPRAVFWAGGSIHRLPDLGTDAEGNSQSEATVINRHGLIGGSAQWYVDHQLRGTCAMLWSGGRAIIIDDFVPGIGGCDYGVVTAINDRGQVAGTTAWGVGSEFLGVHGFRWEDGRATDLGALQTGAGGFSYSAVTAMNERGVAVGESEVYDQDGQPVGEHAVVSIDGEPFVDLNTLVDPADVARLVIRTAVAVNDRGDILVVARSNESNDSPMLTQALLLVPRGWHHHHRHHRWHGCGRDDDDAASAKRGGWHCDR